MKIFNFLFPWKHNSKQRRKCAVTSLRQGVSIVSKGVSKATQLNYQTAVCSFLMFKAKDDVLFSTITQAEIVRYQQWLQQRAISANTTTCYLRSLRALYNKAVKRRLVKDIKP
ncbi:MAG: phage integrase SAM-like domain-containing protein, partial [Prevotella salivae]|nr:phage integrase SAM-like domain-containing protein [Segatella salivae]